jgi:hypothetical protein
MSVNHDEAGFNEPLSEMALDDVTGNTSEKTETGKVLFPISLKLILVISS